MTHNLRLNKNRRAGTSLIWGAAIGLALLALVGAVATGPAMAAQSNASAADATAAKDRAAALLSQLQDLEEDHPDIVADDRIESVKNSITSGDSEFELGRYGAAESEYQTATEKARGSLTTYYADATQMHLAAANETINEFQDDEPGRAQELESRSSEISNDLQSAESIADYRGIHDRADTLKETAEDDLSPTLMEKAVANLNPILAGVTAISVVGLGVQTRRRRSALEKQPEPEDEDDDDDDDEDEDTVPYEGNNRN